MSKKIINKSNTFIICNFDDERVMMVVMETKSSFRLFLIFIIIVFCSCKEQTDIDSLLSQAQNIVEQNPDSALILLDSIDFPESDLSKDDYMHYLVTLVQAKYKSYVDISEDTLIVSATDYFEKKEKWRDAVLSNFYTGCVYQEQKQIDKALQYYLKAKNISSKVEENKDEISGLISYTIGVLYFDENIPDSALVHFKRAHAVYDDPVAYTLQQMSVIDKEASTFLLLGKRDSAIAYYKQNLDLARKHNNKAFESSTLQKLGVIYREAKDYDMAKSYIFKALAIKEELNSTDLTRIYFSLSRLHDQMHQPDSASYYAYMAENEVSNTNDIYLLTGLYKHLSQLEEKRGNYQNSLKYMQLNIQALEQLYNQQNSTALIKIEKKYNIAQKERQLIEMQMREQSYFFFVILSVLTLIVAFLIMNVIKNKHKREKQKNALLQSQVQNMLFLTNMYKNITTESVTFEKEVESVSINYGVKEKSEGYGYIQQLLKKMKKDTQNNLTNLTRDFLVNQSVNDSIISSLNPTEMLFLALVRCGYEYKDIAIILNTNMHALQMRKQRLKSKLKNEGMSDQQLDLFLP